MSLKMTDIKFNPPKEEAKKLLKLAGKTILDMTDAIDIDRSGLE